MISVCLHKIQSFFILACILIIGIVNFPRFPQVAYAASSPSMQMQSAPEMKMTNNNGMNTMDMSDMPLPPPIWAINIGKLGGTFNIFEINTPFYNILIVVIDLISVMILLFSLYRIITSIKEFGKSTLGAALIYLLNGNVVLGAVIIIFILADTNIYRVHDVTEMTLWHLMFSYAVILFFASGNILSSLANITSNKNSYTKALYYLYFSIILSICVIIAMPYTDNFFVKYIQPTSFSQDGYFHIIAFSISIISAIYLYQIRKKYAVINSIAGQLYIVLGTLAAIHLWELLIESWKWVIVSGDVSVLGDRILWIPVFIFMLHIHTKLKNPSTNVTSPPTGTTNLPQPIPTTETSVPQTASPGQVQTPAQTTIPSPDSTLEIKPEEPVS